MTMCNRVIALLALATLAAPVAAQDDGSVALRHRTLRTWDVQLPAESFKPVSGAIRLGEGIGYVFKAVVDGTALRVDTDGDGEVDVKLDGAAGVITLQTPTSRYSVRLKNTTGWHWAASGVAEGKVDGTRIRIVDQDNDGRYDGVGTDALLIGRTRRASFLSEVINLDGKLHSLKVAADGTSMTLTPYEGDRGVVELGFNTRAKVLRAILKSTDGRYSFDLAGVGKALTVPAAEYILVDGDIGLGKLRVKMRSGRSNAVTVSGAKPVTMNWGGPVKAEFAYDRSGGAVGLSPDKVWYYGKNGEEYYKWFPAGESPEFTILEKDSRKPVAVARFPGSC